MTRRNPDGTFAETPSRADELRAARERRIAKILSARGFGDPDLCWKEARFLVTYAYQANVVELRDVDDVLATCMKRPQYAGRKEA